MRVFSLIEIGNFERGPKANLFLFCFLMSEHNLWQNSDARNVTLANLWIKCLQCGNNFIITK